MNSIDRLQLTQCLDRDRVLVLTANNRLARRLAVEYDDAMQAAGKPVWSKPQILPFESWCRQQAAKLLPDRLWLTPWQEQSLWEQVIESSPEAKRGNLQVSALARQALAAHRLLVQYLVKTPPDWPLTDYQVFLGWRRRWQERLDVTGRSDASRIPLQLAEVYLAAPEALPKELVLAGFDTLRPDQQLLIESFRAAGRPISQLQDPLPACRQMQVPAADAESEVRLAACWARRQLQQGVRRIGIVATDLGFYQPLIERIFRAELDPAAVRLESVRSEAPFSLSLGVPLAGEGVVSAALQLLRLGRQVTTADLGRLLTSPFLGDHQAPLARRGLLDVRLRRSGQTHWSWSQLRRFDPLFAESAPREGSVLARLAAACTAIRPGQRLSAGDWALQFARTLAASGWPGVQPLDSRGWQAVESFRDLLLQLGSLDAVSEPLERAAAVDLLQRLTREQTFQPESHDGPLLVTGLLESTGLQFDRLWLLGMHDGIFPASPHPNPLLPLPLQRRLQMPHADAERELEFSCRLAERLLGAAPEVVASFPAQVDGVEQAASPFVADWSQVSPELAKSVDPQRVSHLERPAPETLEDSRGRPLSTRKPVTGGTALLKDQALCPFRAFAHHRLRAEGLEVPDLGLDLRARGILVHALLEQFWRLTVDQAALQRLAADELRARLQQAAGLALDQFEAREKRALSPRLRMLESRRLVELGWEWVQVEAGRSPFRVRTDDLEKLQTVQVGALQVRTRIDRIDELAAGGLAVIDYKTGRPDPQQWFETRLSEPQLPLYALGVPDGELAAVVFAAVRRGGCQFRGLVRDPRDFPRLPERAVLGRMAEAGHATLEPLREQWRSTLERLAAEYLAGAASVDPVDLQTTCRSCDLPSLCRIGERAQAGAGEGR